MKEQKISRILEKKHAIPSEKLTELYNDESVVGGKRFLEKADEYAYQRYGIGAAVTTW